MIKNITIQNISIPHPSILFSILFLSLLIIQTSLEVSSSQSDENSRVDSKTLVSINLDNNLQKINSFELKPPPLKQTKQGVLSSEVECKQGSVLLIKSNQKIPACVSPITATKLMARSWGIPSTSLMLSPVNENKVQSHIEQIVSNCQTKTDCIIDSLTEVAINEKKYLTLRTYGGIITWYEESLGYCHGLGHHLGMFLYDYTSDLQEALFYADQRCGLSQIHGVVHKFFQKQFSNTDPKLIEVSNICPEISNNSYSLDRWACLHGMGHGLTESFNYDVFSAVDRCGEMSSRWEEMSCSKGAFMENINEFLRSDKATFDETDILFPCNNLDLKYSPACYHYQTNYIRAQPDYTVEGAFKICDMIEPKDLVKYCYYGMGRLNAGNSLDDYQRALNFCDKGSDFYQQYCFTGTLSSLVSNRGTDQGFEYCKFLPIEFKTDCYDVMGKWIIMFYSSDQERKTQCSKAENLEFSKVCINASLDNIILL